MVTGMLDKPMPTLHAKAPEIPIPLAADRRQVPDASEKEERFARRGQLLRALEPFLPGRYAQEIKIDESPYAGSPRSRKTDAARFFGRRQEIAAVVNRIRERPLLGIVGPSGAGKSSFVRAGLVPALKRGGENWDSQRDAAGAQRRSPRSRPSSTPLIGTATSVDRRRGRDRRRRRRSRRSRATSARCCVARPARQEERARLRRSVRGALHARARCRPSGRPSRRRWRRPRRRSQRRRFGWCSRSAPTSSTAPPKTRASWPSSASGPRSSSPAPGATGCATRSFSRPSSPATSSSRPSSSTT
jgi:hypothetical protein